MTQPDEALAGYSLSTDEAAQIRSHSRENLENFARDLSALEGEMTDEALQAVVGARPNNTARSCDDCTHHPNWP